MAQMVKCKNCGAEFQSRVQMSEESFKTTMLGNNIDCPQCKQESTFTEEDYYFQIADGRIT